MNETSFPSEWVKGVLPFAVLSILAREDMHGYQVSSALRSAGLGRIGGGTIYPLLARLQEAELLSFSWQIEETGPARKVFSLTPKGSLRFNELIADWRRLDATITSIRKVV